MYSVPQGTWCEELPAPSEIRREGCEPRPELDDIESDDGSDCGDAPGWGTPTLAMVRDTYRYQGVVNTAVEHQLVELLASPVALYSVVSIPFVAGSLPSGAPVTYREVYMELTVPIEMVRVIMPGVPNLGYVFGDFEAVFTADEGFYAQVRARMDQDRPAYNAPSSDAV